MYNSDRKNKCPRDLELIHDWDLFAAYFYLMWNADLLIVYYFRLNSCNNYPELVAFVSGREWTDFVAVAAAAAVAEVVAVNNELPVVDQRSNSMNRCRYFHCLRPSPMDRWISVDLHRLLEYGRHCPAVRSMALDLALNSKSFDFAIHSQLLLLLLCPLAIGSVVHDMDSKIKAQ